MLQARRATHLLSSTSFARIVGPSRARFYHERVIDHYENPRNVGSLDKSSPHVGTGLVGAPACGDVMKLQIEVKDGKIVKAVFKTFGCGSAIASSSLATEWIQGKSLDDAKTIKNTQIAKHLSLPPVKLHCSMLAEDAIRASIEDYEKKQKAAPAPIWSSHLVLNINFPPPLLCNYFIQSKSYESIVNSFYNRMR